MYKITKEIYQEYQTEISKLSKLHIGKMNKILDKLIKYNGTVSTYRDLVFSKLRSNDQLEIVFELNWTEINRLEKKLDWGFDNPFDFDKNKILNLELEKAKTEKIKKYRLSKESTFFELSKLEFLKIVEELI